MFSFSLIHLENGYLAFFVPKTAEPRVRLQQPLPPSLPPFNNEKLTVAPGTGCELSLNPVFLLVFHWLKGNGFSCWDLRELEVEMDLMEMIPMDPRL